MASTFIRAFAIMLALTGFGATTIAPGSTASSTPQQKTVDGGGLTGAPICTNNLPNCGLD